jgi:Glycosyl transferase family 2
VTERPSRCHILVERAAQKQAATNPGEIRAFAKCRNERLRLPAFLKHYRDLGVRRFFIVDNDSSDGTAEYLADQPDVRLFAPSGGFREASGGIDWLNALLAEFGDRHWCLTVDIDELLCYPGSEFAPLRTLTAFLDRHGYEAVGCLLLDVYPGGPLAACSYKEGDDLLAAAPYFDAGPYERIPIDLCPGFLIRGGMRERIFYPQFRTRGPVARIYEGIRGRVARRLPRLHDIGWLRPAAPPVLTKVPLVRWDRQTRYLSPHWVSPKAVAPVTGALLHFKFLADFHERAVHEAARGEHYDSAAEYRRYAQTLAGAPDFSLMNEGSTRFEGTAQLVRLGLMHDPQAWADARTGIGT